MTDTPAGTTTGQPAQNGSSSTSMNAAVGIGADLLDEVQDVLKGGKIRGIRIKIGNRTIREIPVQAAAFTALLLAAAAVLVSQLRIEIDKG